MERLTASPRIVDIYGHGGLTILSETMPHEVAHSIVPGTRLRKQQSYYNNLDVMSANNITAEEKLDMAIEMAESLADLRGFSRSDFSW